MSRARSRHELSLQPRRDPIPDPVRLLAFCWAHSGLNRLAVEFARGYQGCGLRVSALLEDIISLALDSIEIPMYGLRIKG